MNKKKKKKTRERERLNISASMVAKKSNRPPLGGRGGCYVFTNSEMQLATAMFRGPFVRISQASVHTHTHTHTHKYFYKLQFPNQSSTL